MVNELGLVSGDTFDVYVEDGEIRFVPVVIRPKREVERLERLASEAEAQLAHGEFPVYDDAESAIEKPAWGRMMAYGLVLAPSFRKAYAKLERQEQALVERKMIVLASDPWHLSFTCYGGEKTVSLADMLSQQTEDQPILVDLLDRPRGSIGKLACHQQGRLHRAFSLFLYRERNDAIELLVQRRAEGKYHSGGLLANSVCSHPRVGSLEQAVPRASRRSLAFPRRRPRVSVTARPAPSSIAPGSRTA